MATFVRNKVLNQLSWTVEGDYIRGERRRTLCELDGLLIQLEEINLRGGEVPQRVLVNVRRRGVAVRPRTTAAELIESIFILQERFMRQPEGQAQADPLPVGVLRRRAAG